MDLPINTLADIHEDVRILREEISTLTHLVRQISQQTERQRAAESVPEGTTEQKIPRPKFVNGYLNVKDALESKGILLDQDMWNALLVQYILPLPLI